MSGKGVRSELERPTDLTDFSPSRLTTAGKCGLAFEYQYVRKMPAPFESARAMFGNAIHDGVEEWYGPNEDADPERHRDLDLVAIVLSQWQKLLPPVIWERVMELRDLDEECQAVAAAILLRRPQLKSPTTTKEFIESDASKEFNEKRDAMVGLCDALAEVKWPQTEDPFKAYALSAKLAAQMQTRWKPLPRPIAVEVPFLIEVDGFRVRGRIDQLRADPDRNTGELRVRMVDIKTGTQAMTQMEAFLQSYLYYEAIEQIAELPSTNGDIAFYLARHDKYQQGKIDPKRHTALASRILNGRAKQIIMGQFEPSYGFWCKQCDFTDLCSAELSLWQGDGLTVELLD